MRRGSNPSDQDLKEFTSLVDALKGDAARFARYLLGTSAHIDDVISLTFITVWEKWEVRPNTALQRAWVIQIVNNHARNRIRAEIARRRSETSVRDVDFGVSRDSFETPRIELLRECLNALDDEELTIVVMVYWEAKPQTLVAPLIGVSEAALNMRLSRIRQKLRGNMVRLEALEDAHHVR